MTLPRLFWVAGIATAVIAWVGSTIPFPVKTFPIPIISGGTHCLPSSPAQVHLPPARLAGRGGGGERGQRVHGRQLAACAPGDSPGGLQGVPTFGLNLTDCR